MIKLINKVAIYVRVSTEDQVKEGYSISEQIDKLKMYCSARSWQVYKVYTDAGFSGSNTDRPALKQLQDDIGNFDTVLVYKLDRLSRSQKDTLYLIEDVFLKNNIGFLSLSENFDTTTPFGKAMIGILSVFAQLEREQIKERMQLGKIGRAKSGKSMSWARDPFGYKYAQELDKLEIVPLQAKVVKAIFNDYLAGISITKLRDKLNEEGHVGKDIKWSYRTLRQTLDNPVYIGKQKFKGEIYDANHEPIIDIKIYNAVQEELKIRQIKAYEQNNNPRPFQAKYMLSGRVRCGYCGAPLEIQMGKVRKSGERTYRYNCKNRLKKNVLSPTVYNDGKLCNSGFYYKNDIETYVIDAIDQLKYEKRDLSDAVMPNKIDKKSIEKEIQDIAKKLDKYKNMYINDLMSIEELRLENEKLLKQKNSLLGELNNEPNLVLADKIKENLNLDIKSLNYDQQRKAVSSLIQKVDVKDGEIAIKWAF